MQIEILEEKLKLAESELQAATERAENAEKELDTLKAPPIPPPPPPPPLLLTSSPTPASSIRLKTVLNLNSTTKKENPVEDMEKLLGIDQNTPKKQPYIPPAGKLFSFVNHYHALHFLRIWNHLRSVSITGNVFQIYAGKNIFNLFEDILHEVVLNLR